MPFTGILIAVDESKTLMQQDAEKTLDQYIKMYDGIGEVFRFTPEGIPEKEIPNIAIQWKADLIVMGTHAHSTLDRLMSGSAAGPNGRYP
jgi:nucleotide-binding universal stress UspA family protein